LVIAKVFEERPVDWQVRDLVFGVLVMEDLVAIALVAICTTVAFGAEMTAASVGRVLGKLALLLAVMVAAGVIIVPRAIRFVVGRFRSETVLLTALGLAFAAAAVTELAGFSVALGAFVAGMLMSESGVGHQVGEVIRPVRDLFSAVFFVAVGMLLDVSGALAAAPIVLVFVAVVVFGKLAGVSVGAFLNGFGVRNSVRAGMTMGQIGEFSFIIAGLGVTSVHSTAPLYPVAVATALVTAFLTPALAARAEAVALAVDRALPRPIQTFASLYGSWVETLFRHEPARSIPRVRRLVRFLVVDTIAVGAILAATGILYRGPPPWLDGLKLPPPLARGLVLVIGTAIALPFGLGLMLAVRRLARLLADAAVPPVAPGKVDQGRAPRRVLGVALKIALVAATGLPLVAVTVLFLPPFSVPAVLGTLFVILGVSLWRSTRELQSHARAGAEPVAHVLARQGATADAESFEVVRQMLPGLGTLVPVRVPPGSDVVGRSLGELNIRGHTGATVVALCRGDDQQVFPGASERLQAGDLIAVTGSHDAISRVEARVRARGTSTPPTDTAATAGHAG
jgi:CPA2 family monovalent cation:H+ antiporter-2